MLYDLDAISRDLPGGFKKFRSLSAQISSANSTSLDLREAHLAINDFWEWHYKQVIPQRGEYTNDTFSEARVGKALFILAVARWARAIDEGAKGRARIDFYGLFNIIGMQEAFFQIKDFRNKEFAHYEGFHIGDRPFSDDRSLLCIGKYRTHIALVWNRYFSCGSLAIKLQSLMNFAIPFVYKYMNEKRNLILEELYNNANLRAQISIKLMNHVFDETQFFPGSVREQRDVHKPDGPSRPIPW